MRIRCYLAMTGAEFSATPQLSHPVAWMACHFSSYGTGLSNLPPKLPKGSVVIVNDRTPPQGHNMDTVVSQLQQIREAQEDVSFLFDFQRPDDKELTSLVSRLEQLTDCPIAISEIYGKSTSHAVFLQAPPPHASLKKHVADWQNRELWLELALETEKAVVTHDGCRFERAENQALKKPFFYDKALACHYRTHIFSDRVEFMLQRNGETIPLLLQEAEELGIKTAVGLYQQLHTSL